MNAVGQLKPDRSQSPPSVPRLNLEGLDSDEEVAARQPHPLDLLDSYDEISDQDTGIGPSYHSDRQSQHQDRQQANMNSVSQRSVASNEIREGDEIRPGYESPSNGRTQDDEEQEVPINLADPEDVQDKLANLNFTEEQEEELLQQAYEMNKMLRQRLASMAKGEKKRSGKSSQVPAAMQRAKTMYEGQARIGGVKKLPPLPKNSKSNGSRPPLPHPPTHPKRSSTSMKRPSRSLESSAAGRRVQRPEWNDRFTTEI